MLIRRPASRAGRIKDGCKHGWGTAGRPAQQQAPVAGGGCAAHARGRARGERAKQHGQCSHAVRRRQHAQSGSLARAARALLRGHACQATCGRFVKVVSPFMQLCCKTRAGSCTFARRRVRGSK